MNVSCSQILVINCGSSSLKFALLPLNAKEPSLSGIAECLGLADARIIFKTDEGKETASLHGAEHAEALTALTRYMAEKGCLDSIVAIGHRVVHGGERFHASVLLTQEVLAGIEACSTLAPLHNPANLVGIRAAQQAFPKLPQVVVFDTSFHQTMPATAYLYGISQHFYKDYGVRRYGMHGTSHRYIAEETVKKLNLDPSNHGILIAHLGNGASATAVKNGKSVDTTMGMTPLEGLIMGTRSGDIDPGAVTYIARKEQMDLDGIDNLLNKKSGLLGISGLSSDCRDLELAAAEGNTDAALALDMFAHRLARLLGGLAMSLNRLDALVFTGGIGENSALMRHKAMDRLGILGFAVDDQANQKAVRGAEGVISTPNSRLALVMPTNEEWMIAQDTARLAGLQ